MVGLTSDQEFLIKVHCIRLGYRILFEDSRAASWFASRSRQIVSRLFYIADKVGGSLLIQTSEREV